MEELFSQMIAQQVQKTTKMTVTSGTVTKVREHDCDVKREQMPELLGVRFHSIIGDMDNFVRVVPKKDSQVLCAIIENDISEAVVIATSEVEKVLITIDKAEFVMEAGKYTIKNDKADLKEIGLATLDQLIKAIIQTPAGPGNFSPADVQVFEQQKEQLNKLFN